MVADKKGSKNQKKRRRLGSTYSRCILREIKQSFGRFVAMIGIVALGVGFLLGILSATPDLKASMSRYYQDRNMCDLFIKSTLGLTQEDVQVLSELDEVEAVMPAYVQDMIVQTEEEETLVARIIGSDALVVPSDSEISSTVNQLTLEEGRMPDSPTECVVERAWGERIEFPLGSKLTIADENDNDENLKDVLREKELTVVGIVTNPFYISTNPETSSIGNGRVTSIVYTMEDTFSMDVYTDFFMKLAGSDEYEYFSDSYEAYVAEQIEALQPAADAQAAKRYEKVYAEAEKEILAAEKEWKKGKEEAEKAFAEGKQQLDDAKNELEEGQMELSKAEAQLDVSWEALQSGRAELDAGWAQIQAAQAAYESGQKEYSDAKVQYDEGQAAFDEAYSQYEEAVIQYRVGQSQLETAQEQYAQVKEIYEALKEELSRAIEVNRQQLIERLEDLKNLMPEGNTIFLDQLIDYIKQGDVSDTQIQELFERVEAALAQMEEQIAEGKKELEEAGKQLEDGQRELDANKGQLAAANKQLIRAEIKLELAQEELSEGTATLDEKEAEYNQGLAAYKEGVASYERGQKKLEEGQAEYEQGVQELEEQKQSTERKLADGERKLRSARSQLEELECKWYLLDLGSNVGYASFKINVEKVADVAKIFPVFFFLVSALVTLTTMTRMVEEERTQIGTLKALGYSKGKILSKYMIYCGLATAIGCLVGILAGFRLLPVLIRNSYSALYRMPPLILRFDWMYALLSCLAEFICTMGATLAASLHSLKEKPAFLMLPRVPKAGQRILIERWKWLWKHLSFSYKATARNIFRYKRHLFMTIIGVGGCTALMLAAFGLRDSMSKIVSHQYESIWQYDLEISTDGTQDEILTAYLKEKASTAVMNMSVKAMNNGESVTVTLMAAENPAEFPEMIHLVNRKNGKTLEFEERSVILTEKLAEQLGLNIGDVVQLEKTNGKTALFTVTGITENYVGSYVYMGREVYEEGFGSLSVNMFLVQSGAAPEDQDQEIENLLSSSSVAGGEFTSQKKKSYDNLMSSMNFIVLVLIVAACGLALIVLYNLTNININERTKELATLRVLGYHHREVGAYIFREINLLSAFGALVGIALGVLLYHYVILVAESTDLMFGRGINPWSYVGAFGVTMLISLLVDMLMWIKIKRIHMAESMKAVD